MKWSEFTHVSEEFNSKTGEFQYSMFAAIDLDDTIYYCELPTRKSGSLPSKLQLCVSRFPPVRYS